MQRINATQKDRFLNVVRETLWVLREKKIAVWGLTFKPDTDDIRSSVAIDLVDRHAARRRAGDGLRSQGNGESARMTEMPCEAKFAAPAGEAVADAEALIVATEWNEFCEC